MAIDKNSVIKESQKYVARGQYDKAIAEWKKLLTESPNDAGIFNTIGDLCLKKDTKSEAVEAYRRAADILASDGFTSKAIALYKKVLNIDPKKIEVHLALADLNAEKGLTGNALESYKYAADHYVHNGEQEKALGIYQKMADLNPSNITFRIKLAELYAKEGMKEESVKAYLQAADAHISKNAFKEARQLFEKALTVIPNNREVYYKAGVVYFNEGKFVEACKSLKPVFENDPANKEVVEIYLDALSKAGRDADAEEAFKKLLSLDPDRTDFREKLFHIYLARNEHDKALNEAATIAEARLKGRDTGGENAPRLLTGDGDAEMDEATNLALSALKNLVARNPGYAEGRRTLSEFYAKVGRRTDAARELVVLAKMLAPGDKDGAKGVLARAIELAPDLIEAQKLFESLQDPPPPEPEPEPPVQEPEMSVSEPETRSESLSLSPPPDDKPQEDPAIQEALTEIEVLVKYGLATKAIEQVEALVGTYPESEQVRKRLCDLYGDQGNMKKAAGQIIALADIYARTHREDQVEGLLRDALQIDPGNSELKARLGIEDSPKETDVPDEPVTVFEKFEDEAPSLDITSALDMAETGQEALSSEAGKKAVSGIADKKSAGPKATRQDLLQEESLSKATAPTDPGRESAKRFKEPSRSGLQERREPVQKRPKAVDLDEIWSEAEFYFQQGLFDEAQKHYAKLLDHRPGDQRARDRLTEISREVEKLHEFSKLADAVDELGAKATPGPSEEMAPSRSDEDAVRSLMQEIAKLKQAKAAEVLLIPEKDALRVPKPQKTAPPIAGKKKGRTEESREEDFFDLGEELRDEEVSPAASKDPGRSANFFDLASELRDELTDVSVAPPAAPEDQSLDDIFEEFKKGVEQQAIKEDVDTHYNLGVAYKEMGLLDDAIAEFILAPQDEPKFSQNRYMLGLCYMEKGDYQNAIAEILNALNYREKIRGGRVRDLVNLRYDLGLAYQGAGDPGNALSQFRKVFEADPGYRDAANKIKELQEGDFISLEQLKDDIEKEISSKFLEEGERIEREEKNRKNEKVTN